MFCSLFLSRFKLLSTGQTPRYFNWDENEPNSYGGDQDCVTIGYYGHDRWDTMTHAQKVTILHVKWNCKSTKKDSIYILKID